MKSWKKSWKAQLDKVVPPLNEDIKNMPINASQVSTNGDGTLVRSKKITVSIAIILIAVIITGIALACTLPFSKKAVDELYAFTVEINPSITLTTDGNGTVKAVMSSNADADIILANKDVLAQIVGQPLDKAIASFADNASRLGFLDVNKIGSAIRISACERGDSMLNVVQNTLQSYFIDKGIFAVVISETVNLDEFTVRSGIVAENIDALTSIMANHGLLYNDRKAQSSNTTQLIEIYKEEILSSNVVNIIKDYMYENLELIKQIEGFIGISAEKIKEVLDNFTTELLMQYSSLFESVLDIIGATDSRILSVLQLPTNLQEFTQVLSNALELEFNYRKKHFEDIYNEIRTVTEEQYTAFVNEILQSYGSLENYWQTIK